MSSSGSSSLPPLSGRIARTGLGRLNQSVGVPSSAFNEAGAKKSVVIVVHGTSSRHAPYMKPGSRQFAELQAQYPSSRVIPFYWSGDLSRTDRQEAGTHLGEVIEKFSKLGVNVEAVIAHSHGSNVFKEAANALSSKGLGPLARPMVNTFIAIASPERMEHSRDGLGDKSVCGQVIQVEGGRDFVKPLGEVSPADAVRTGKAALTQLASTLKGLLPGALRRTSPQAPWAHAQAVLPRATHKALVHHGDTFADALTQARTLSLESGQTSLAKTGQGASQTGPAGPPIRVPGARGPYL